MYVIDSVSAFETVTVFFDKRKDMEDILKKAQAAGKGVILTTINETLEEGPYGMPCLKHLSTAYLTYNGIQELKTSGYPIHVIYGRKDNVLHSTAEKKHLKYL